jgi:hypothetical protein
MFFYKLLNFFYNYRILGQASRKIGESVGSISRGPTPARYHRGYVEAKNMKDRARVQSIIFKTFENEINMVPIYIILNLFYGNFFNSIY